ncbi:hypothetical protein RND81_05G026600 [Saponaria officinalis]|uniref:Uncharacterized protein n=1 Tax=Saponaria officinalis TaxID=3572 RepID=A0AAW1KTJ5_SAPOF
MEESTKSIQHEIGGVYTDALRFGFHGVKSDILEVHPLQSATQSAKKIQRDMNKKVLANTYGSAFPIKLDLDRQILTRFQRPPGPIPSSMLGLEAYTGALDDIGFEDYLNGNKMLLLLCPPVFLFCRVLVLILAHYSLN